MKFFKNSKHLFIFSRIIDVSYIIIGMILYLKIEPYNDTAMVNLITYILLAGVLLMIKGLIIFIKYSNDTSNINKHKVDLLLNSIIITFLMLIINLYPLIKLVEYIIRLI